MHWFDTREGKLIVGEAAYETSIENSFPGDIIPLSHAVLARTIDFPTEHYERVDARSWTEEDYVRYGKWVIDIISRDDRYNGFKRDYIDRLGKLGIGPGRQPLLKNAGPRYADFLERLDEKPYNKLADDYSKWTRRNYAAYATKLAGQLGKPATTDDYTAASQRSEGPSPWMMSQYLGTPGEINELIGYPNVYFWEREDFVEWGARAMDINNGAVLTHRILTTLSKRGRGPGFGTVKDEFGKLSEFQRQATDRYNTDPSSRQPRERKACTTLDKLAAMKLLNTWQLEYIKKADIDIVAFTAKVAVLQDLLPDADELELGYVALESIDDFTEKILTERAELSLEDIQLAAIATKHTDDIWQLSDRWAKDLRVTKQQLRYKHKANSHKFGPPSQKEAKQSML